MTGSPTYDHLTFDQMKILCDGFVFEFSKNCCLTATLTLDDIHFFFGESFHMNKKRPFYVQKLAFK